MSLLILLVLTVVAVFPSHAADRPDTADFINRLLDIQKGFLEGEGDEPSLDIYQIQQLAALLGEETSVVPDGCQCSSALKSCTCCANINLLKTTSKACAKISYNPYLVTLIFALSWNDKTVIEKSVSVKNPRPLCVNMSATQMVKFCIQLYGIDWKYSTPTVCLRFNVTVNGKNVVFLDLGCFSFSPFKHHWNHEVSQTGEAKVMTKSEFWKVEDEGQPFQEPETQVSNGCQCGSRFTACSCCTHINIPKTKFNFDACGNLTYDNVSSGFLITLTVAGKTVFQHQVTLKGPKEYCLSLPGVRLGKLCLDFYDLDWTTTYIKGCLCIRVLLLGTEVTKITLGCFQLGSSTQTLSQDVAPSVVKLLSGRQTTSARVSDAQHGGWRVAARGASSYLQFRPGVSHDVTSRLMLVLRPARVAGAL